MWVVYSYDSDDELFCWNTFQDKSMAELYIKAALTMCRNELVYEDRRA